MAQIRRMRCSGSRLPVSEVVTGLRVERCVTWASEPGGSPEARTYAARGGRRAKQEVARGRIAARMEEPTPTVHWQLFGRQVSKLCCVDN
jgi:hypothetical protein